MKSTKIASRLMTLAALVIGLCSQTLDSDAADSTAASKPRASHPAVQQKRVTVYVHDLDREIEVDPRFHSMTLEQQNAEVDRAVETFLKGQQQESAKSKKTNAAATSVTPDSTWKEFQLEAFGWRIELKCSGNPPNLQGPNPSAIGQKLVEAVDAGRCVVGRLALEGTITKDVADFGVAAIKSHKRYSSVGDPYGSENSCGRPPWLNLNSDGGSLREALRIGRAIRAVGMTTVVAGRCHSACAFLYFAGVERWNAGTIGLHRPYFSPSAKGATKRDVATAMSTIKRELEAYFDEMGLERSLLDFILRIGPDGIETYESPSRPVADTDPAYEEWFRLNCRQRQDERRRAYLIDRFGDRCGMKWWQLLESKDALLAKCNRSADRPSAHYCEREVLDKLAVIDTILLDEMKVGYSVLEPKEFCSKWSFDR